MTTKDIILNAAVTLARTTRYDRLTRGQIASAAGCATGSINYYFTDMAGLRTALVERAIAEEEWRVVAAAVMDGVVVTPEQRTRALASV